MYICLSVRTEDLKDG